jgi:hypothetical protein
MHNNIVSRASHGRIVGSIQVCAVHDVAFDVVLASTLGSSVQAHVRLTTVRA